MGRLGSALATVLVLAMTAGFGGCGGSSKAPTINPPAKVSLTPSLRTSLELGAHMAFTATPQTASGQPQPSGSVTFRSSNSAVVTIASNGQACAGTWDSLTAPTICTPGSIGIAQVTATSNGAVSAPTDVYVHQHIDSITLSVTNPPAKPCLSIGQSAQYTATAFSHGSDITSSVGQFSWQAVNPTVVTLSNTSTSLLLNEATATAKVPGFTTLYASNNSTNGVPATSNSTVFQTCAVQSITLNVKGSGSTTLSVPQGTGESIQTTVIDTQGNTITGAPLTWSASIPNGASTGTTAGDNSSLTAKAGGGAVIGSCTPPTCNIGFQSSDPRTASYRAIYPATPVSVTATGKGTPLTASVFVTTRGCQMSGGPVIQNCVPALISISIPKNTEATVANLPSPPNSLVFSADGSTAYMGTDFSQQGTWGLMVFLTKTSAVSQIPSVIGKVLAVSNNGGTAIVADNLSSTQQVYIVNWSGTAVTSVVPLGIRGATAAAFSIDGSKAYILANDALATSHTLYIYSTQEALKTVPLTIPATDLTFLSNGAFAYVAGGTSAVVRSVCDSAAASDPVVSIPGSQPNSVFVRSLNDASQILALNPPNIDLVPVTTTQPTLGPGAPGCPLTVSHSATVPVNLGHGNFEATQFLLSADNSAAYIVVKGLGSILVYNVFSGSTSAIPLTGNVTPTQAALTLDNTRLLVGASDGTVHVLDLLGNADIQQVSFPFNPSNLQGLCNGNSTQQCFPDLVALQP